MSEATVDVGPWTGADRWTGRARPWRAVAPAVFAAAWGGNHFTPLMLMYRQHDGYTTMAVDVVFAAYVAGLVPGFLLSGALSDRYGRKRVMVPAVVLGIAASAALATGVHTLPLMCLGRLLSGLSVAAAMVVGTSWLRELSQGPWEQGADDGTGAARASVTLTLGFGVGAGVSGALAQWAPGPSVLPYVVHVLLSLWALAALVAAPETRRFDADIRSLLADLRVPAASRRRFLLVLTPLAPWVFAGAALAYAVLPALLHRASHGEDVAVAAVLALVTLGTGALVQVGLRRLPPARRRHAPHVGMGAMAVGAALCARAAAAPTLWLAAVAAVVLGLGYGICMVTGLVEVQRLTDEEHLAGLTGVYYSLTYLGFTLPVVLAWLQPFGSYPVLLTAVAALAVVCGAVVAVARRTIPVPVWPDESAAPWLERVGAE